MGPEESPIELPSELQVLFGTSGPMPADHLHHDLELNYVHCGLVRYSFQGRLADVSAGSFAVFWGAQPHRVLDTEPGTEFTVVHVPLALALSCDVGGGFTTHLLRGEVMTHVGDPWDDAVTRGWVLDFASGEAELAKIVGIEIHARLRRLAQSLTLKLSAEPPPSPAPGRHHTEAMLAYIQSHFREPLRVADVAAAAGVHPHHAMALFRKTLGVSIHRYVTRLRLSQAELLLLDGQRPIVDVAFEAGFNSLPRFYSVFGQAHGMSPSRFRKARAPLRH